MTLKSIEKYFARYTAPEVYPWVSEMLRDIQDEVDGSYMELPVDADGVPIRPDDLMACTAFDTNDFDGKEHVMAVGNGFWVDKDGCTHIPSETRHVKPRTLESILCDALADVSCMGDGIVRHFKPDEPYVVELADEIRELLSGDGR